ncbi:iron-containing alcohol dehydrogenase [Clostridium algoriphilum]|uniref:iron-containing alcohol dehydrogenase n=1 Tax=Clostridium algoriphilum TaxID=198347 RepID=UPI00384DC2EE
MQTAVILDGICAIMKLSEDVKIPKVLKEIGVREEDLKALAQSAMADACTPGNPRDASVKDILGVYTKAFK